jgi:hypothetical protein
MSELTKEIRFLCLSPLPPTPWYDEIPWKYLIPGMIGVILTIIFRDLIIRRVSNFLRKRRFFNIILRGRIRRYKKGEFAGVSPDFVVAH